MGQMHDCFEIVLKVLICQNNEGATFNTVLKVLLCQSNKGATFSTLLKVLISQSNKRTTLNIVITSQLIFMAQGTSLIDHLLY